ncbi:tubulin-tyrosine ligase [Schizosaccharomyces cryophilus OY26]|uniref:Tubulin-tyrosine ligase n=1 Tax=Schizosaccharomyces cryophilus (strain OY26 / ATCC MYA-4695 / CBS 11777 / NBRC 106824 / NRRL Y48691) TaxID=653667 RepID=S9VWW0_SCHCR|nr:tubulin-tyrosine ligase [Schizosaccharomyces cryophilus OY26]EPY50425.1 tubulin-tyrosine ligase [Schizosaccharomyces cryophilus OY26]
MSSFKDTIPVYVNYGDPYVEPKIKNALLESGLSLKFVDSRADANLFWAQYEDIDFDKLYHDPETLACSYVIRKALIRKEYLWNTVVYYLAKNPGSILKKAVPEAFSLELDYAEFLDDSLMESYELRQELEKNEDLEPQQRKWYILKPSMCDGAQGIRIFSTIEELQSIFDSFDEALSDEDESNDSSSENVVENADSSRVNDRNPENKIVIHQIRHFLVQRYIANPLLLNNRKFHIRAYVLAVGGLSVYLFKDMLCLLARDEYESPHADTKINLYSHLSNTCIQGGSPRESSVQAFWNSSIKNKDKVFDSIVQTLGDVFEAASTTQRIHFQPLNNSFEIFGVDFMIDETDQVHLLEVNAFPDFRQTGDELSGLVEKLFKSVVQTAIVPFFNPKVKHEPSPDLVLARELKIYGF